MSFWNELLLAITMVTNPDLRTLAAASLVTAAAPIFILYVFLSERFVEGLTAGAVKG